MGKFRQISTELWPLIDVIFFFFKMIFFALKISRGGVCCMPAALLVEAAVTANVGCPLKNKDSQ